MRPSRRPCGRAPTTPRRWSSGWRSRPGSTSSSTTSSPSIASCPPARRAQIYGIVGQVRARHEGARFDSDVFLIADGLLPAEVSEAALVQVTRVVPETFVPPLPGTEVRRAVGAERDEALDLDDVERAPARRAQPRRRAGRTSTSTSSTAPRAPTSTSRASRGVATKTSYATFLLYSLFNSGVLGAEAANTKALDLQRQGRGPAVPRPRQHPPRRRRAGSLRRARPAGRRRSAASRVLAPPRKGDPNATPATGARTTGVRPLYWTIAQFCAQGLLPFLFADAEDERQQYTIVVQSVTAQLRELRQAERHARRGGAHRRQHGAHVPRPGRRHRGAS